MTSRWHHHLDFRSQPAIVNTTYSTGPNGLGSDCDQLCPGFPATRGPSLSGAPYEWNRLRRFAQPSDLFDGIWEISTAAPTRESAHQFRKACASFQLLNEKVSQQTWLPSNRWWIESIKASDEIVLKSRNLMLGRSSVARVKKGVRSHAVFLRATHRSCSA